MKEKIITFIAGVIVGGVALGTYHFTIGNPGQTGGPMMGGDRPSMDASNMSDTQLEKMATRLGITKDELKKEIDSGKDLRTIMQEKGASFGGRGARTGSGNAQ